MMVCGGGEIMAVVDLHELNAFFSFVIVPEEPGLRMRWDVYRVYNETEERSGDGCDMGHTHEGWW